MAMDPCKVREPRVIDNDLILQCIDYQYPKGEVGRLMREEGIPMEDIQEIRFEFLNILKIDHLWIMKSLTKLQLNNNYIEKIENLETLIHLKELDLSFNKIGKIENVKNLVNLEKLSLFENLIEKLENMESLKKLKIFSVGKNRLADLSDVHYLRKFSELASLNMADNPCTKMGDNFRLYIAVFLPQVIYYEYQRISEDERKEGKHLYKKRLRELQKTEETEYAKIALIEKEQAEAELHSLSFVEYLNTRHLFDDLFADDVEGKAFLEMGEDIEEFYIEFENQFLKYCTQVFEIGQKQYKMRMDEINEFNKTVDICKEENQKQGIEHMEKFLNKRSEIFSDVTELQSLFSTDQISEDIYKPKRKELSKEFEGLRHKVWKELMRLELVLFEQMEDLIQNFDHSISEMINVFLEETQGAFSLVRGTEITYNENLTDVANRYFTNASLNDFRSVPPNLKPFMVDKEALVNAIATTHDAHLQIIDNREDLLTSRAKEWLEDFLTNLSKDEIQRNRAKLLEINHFLDIQRDHFRELISDNKRTIRSDPLEGLI